MSRKIAHILIFPFPAQGHMIPLLDLTHQLSIRDLDITILLTPKNLPLLIPLLSKNPSIQTLLLPFPSHPSIPPGVENVMDLAVAGGFRAMMHVLSNLHSPVKKWFQSHVSPPTAIIFYFFLGWTNRLCIELNIPGYVFSPSGGLALAIIYSLWIDRPKRKDPFNDDEIISFPRIPNCPVYHWWQLSPIYRSFVANESDPISKSIRENFDGDMASFGLVINTALELEEIYLDHLKEVLGHYRVWSIGPVLPPNDGTCGTAERGGGNSILASEILTWLDKCEDDHSVIYVCFGSQVVLRNEQMEALTLGLEQSEANFILCVKGPTKGHKESEKYGLIPSGFEERVTGRGLVIKGWAPQVSILRHCAVGAFFTHCGWNSVLEGIGAGVPMLAWPMAADQFTNATLIVDELKIGVRVCESDKTMPNSDEMARVLAKAVGGFEEERRRAEELQKASLDTVKEGGSSFKNLDNLVLHFSEEASKG